MPHWSKKTLTFRVKLWSIKDVRIWKHDGFVLIKPVLYKPFLTNTSYVIFLLIFDNPCKTSVFYLALLTGHRPILTRTLQLTFSHMDMIPLWLWTLRSSAQRTPTHIEKKFVIFIQRIHHLILSKLFYFIWHSDFKMMGLKLC